MSRIQGEPSAGWFRAFLARTGKSAWLESLLVVLLLLALIVQAGSALERTSLTYDEYMYLPAGYTHWALRDFRIARDHPPLTRIVAGLPLQFMDLSMDRSGVVFERIPTDRVSWLQYDFGEIFLTQDNAERFDALVSAARRAMLVFPLIMAIVVFAWSRELFGPVGALISLSLVAFNPDVLGHGGLVTTDIPMASLFVACIYLFWSHARRPSALKLTGLGIALGLALAAKYSNLLLIPLLSILSVVAWCDRSLRRRPASFLCPFGAGTFGRRLGWTAASVGLVAGLALLVLWAAYLFAESPLAYRRGLDHLYGLANPGFQPYLLGEFRQGRFWSYFVVALGLKLPLATLALLVWAIACGWRQRRGASVLTVAALVVPPLVLFAAMTATTMQIAHRYVFGVYGFAFVAIGCIGRDLGSSPRGRWRAVAVAALVAFSALSGLRAYPFYISYANALVPSPLVFFDYLIDANNDWQHGWREVARLQEAGVLGAVAVHVPQLYARRITPYGLRYAAFDLASGDPLTTDPAPGTYLFSASRYVLAKHSPGADAVPLLSEYPPDDVIAGCVLVVRVPSSAEPPPPEPLMERELRSDDGGLLQRFHVYSDPDGKEVLHGPYEVFRADGTLQEDGWMSHGVLDGPYARYHPNGELAEQGATYHGQLHGTVRRWDEDGLLIGEWDYWQGTPIQGG